MINYISLSCIVVDWICLNIFFRHDELGPVPYLRVLFGAALTAFCAKVFPGFNVLSSVTMIWTIASLILDFNAHVESKSRFTGGSH